LRASCGKAAHARSRDGNLDGMVVRIAAKRMYMWRAVDHEGGVLDMLVQRRRDTRAALRLMHKLLKKQGFAPKLLVTDKLGSYGSAFRQLRLTCPHHRGSEKIIAPKTPIKSRDEMSFMDATVQVVSICAAVFQITGAHWSGPRFFGLTDNPKPFVWTKSPDAILAAVQRGREALEAIH
jgi:hypothetical protein